jgi:hypothetical protein
MSERKQNKGEEKIGRNTKNVETTVKQGNLTKLKGPNLFYIFYSA